jgi:hypothetical protein
VVRVCLDGVCVTFFFISEDTGGMYPELITRPDLKVYLPPIGGISVYIFGNPEYISGNK